MKNILLFHFLFLIISAYSQGLRPSLKLASDSTQWSYAQDTDKMMDQVYYLASINSKNKLQLISGKNEAAVSSLIVQYCKGVNSVGMYLDKGHFTGSTSGFVNLIIRFDKDQPSTYKFHYSHNRTDMIFVDYTIANKLIKRLKKAKKVRIELDFDNSGDQMAEFGVANLKWNYIGKEGPSLVPSK